MTRPWTRIAAALALSAATGLPQAVQAADTTVVSWRFDDIPLWAASGGVGVPDGYASGSFEIVADGDRISVRNPVLSWFPWTPTSTDASRTGFSVSVIGPPDYCYPIDEEGGEACIPKWAGGWNLSVDGDLTKRGTTLPVKRGGFDYTVGHYEWNYGSFARHPDAFVTQVSYVTSVPEPASAALLLAGLGAVLAAAAVRSARRD